MDVKGYIVGALAIVAAAVVLLVLILSIAHNVHDSNADKAKMNQTCVSQGYSGWDSTIGCFGGSKK